MNEKEVFHDTNNDTRRIISTEEEQIPRPDTDSEKTATETHRSPEDETAILRDEQESLAKVMDALSAIEISQDHEESDDTNPPPATPSSRSDWESVRDMREVWPLTIEILQRLLRRKETKAIMEFLDARHEDKILEIGCNTGYLLDQNHKQRGVGVNYTALDQKLSSIAKKRAAKAGANIVEKDGTQTGYEDASFDKIVTSHVLEHFDNPSDLLGEIRRLLTKNGTVIIAVPKEKKFHRLNPRSWPSKFKGHRNHFDKTKTLVKVLGENGFETETNWSSNNSIVIKAKKK